MSGAGGLLPLSAHRSKSGEPEDAGDKRSVQGDTGIEPLLVLQQEQQVISGRRLLACRLLLLRRHVALMPLLLVLLALDRVGGHL
eukprot:3476341-Prymnesium_polylepis.1